MKKKDGDINEEKVYETDQDYDKSEKEREQGKLIL